MPKQESQSEASTQGRDSILSKPAVDVILNQARENLQRDGHLLPVLFVRETSGRESVLGLELPGELEGRQRLFATLGLLFVASHRQVEEALFLSETWYVSKLEDPHLTLPVEPSKHPARREAITIVGRNRPRTRITFVIQSFTRDAKQQPVFEKINIAEYNRPSRHSIEATSILDYFFPRQRRAS